MKIWSWPAVLAWLRKEYELDPEPGTAYLTTREAHELAVRLDITDLAAPV